MSVRTIIFAVLILVISFLGATFGMQLLWPGSDTAGRPALVEVPPLQPTTRSSVIVTPTAIALSAIRDSMESTAPRNLTGKRDNPISQLLSNADIGWTVGRGPLAVTGRPDALAVSTLLSGTFRATGQISNVAGNIGGAIGGLVSGSLGQGVQNLAGKAFDQRADVRGNVTVTSRPALLASWRLEPNLTTQVSIADASLSIAGIKISASNEVKPMLDRSVSEQVTALQSRLRGDPFLEVAARREWAKMCRSLSLGAAGAGLPNLWLEVRPTKAFAAQPRVDSSALYLTIGVQAETRIVPSETKPNCPFPANLELVPPMDQGRVNLAVPIDVPFTEINRLLEAQLTGKTFPEDKSGSFDVTVRRASLAASGDRLLISLRVKARETKSWFSLGTEATVHVWGRPVLDRARQTLRLTDIALDVESEAAFGLLGAAARAAIPYLKDALVENAVVDLKPFAANARKGIEAAIADFRMSGEGVRADAAVTDLRLVGIEYDAKTLRVIAEADGTVKVSVTALPAY
jgi:hypothetical protein